MDWKSERYVKVYVRETVAQDMIDDGRIVSDPEKGVLRLEHPAEPAPKKAPAPNRTQVKLSELESVYAMYPKQTGKVGGLKKAQQTIRTREVFAQFSACVKAMAAAWGAPGVSKQYCPGFAVFINQRRWEDGDWPLPRDAPRLSPAQRILNVAKEMRRRRESASGD